VIALEPDCWTFAARLSSQRRRRDILNAVAGVDVDCAVA